MIIFYIYTSVCMNLWEKCAAFRWRGSRLFPAVASLKSWQYFNCWLRFIEREQTCGVIPRYAKPYRRQGWVDPPLGYKGYSQATTNRFFKKVCFEFIVLARFNTDLVWVSRYEFCALWVRIYWEVGARKMGRSWYSLSTVPANHAPDGTNRSLASTAETI